MCTVWWSRAPQLEDLEVPSTIPLDFQAALDHWSMPRCAEMHLVEFGQLEVPLAAAWRPGITEEVSWVEEVPPQEVEALEETVEENDTENVWLRARRKRWADETDSEESQVDGNFNDLQLQSPGQTWPKCSLSANSLGFCMVFHVE